MNHIEIQNININTSSSSILISYEPKEKGREKQKIDNRDQRKE